MYALRTVNAKTQESITTEFATYREMYEARRESEQAGLYSTIQTSDNEQGEWLIDSTKHYSDEHLKAYRKLGVRIANEKKAVKKVVEKTLRMGYMISLYDGEEYSVKRSIDKAHILANIYQTDMDRMFFRYRETGESVGSVLFVYGNSASEVCADWSDNAEVNAILADAIAFCEKLSEKGE